MARHQRKPRRHEGYGTILLIVVAAVGIPSGLLAANLLAVSPSEDLAGVVYHIHVNIAILVNGTTVPIPRGVGIEPSFWSDHSLDSLGPAGKAPIHTHDGTGLVHVESRAVRDFTLGEFFRTWGLSFNSTCIGNKCQGVFGETEYALTVAVNSSLVDSNETPFETIVLRDGDVFGIRYGSF